MHGLRGCPGHWVFICFSVLPVGRVLGGIGMRGVGKEWVNWKSLTVSDSLQPHGLYSPWNSPGQNTGGGSHSLLQGIFPTQGSSPGLPHCRWLLNQLSHQGSPRILEWAAYPFSRGSSWPRTRTGVSCMVGGFFISWAMREAHRKGVGAFKKGDIFLNTLRSQVKELHRQKIGMEGSTGWQRGFKCRWAHIIQKLLCFQVHIPSPCSISA